MKKMKKLMLKILAALTAAALTALPLAIQLKWPGFAWAVFCGAAAVAAWVNYKPDQPGA